MGSLSEEEDQFFDACDDITSVSDSGSDNLDLDSGISHSFSSVLGFETWIRNPLSIHERRNKLLNSMGLSMDGREEEEEEDNGYNSRDESGVEVDRMIDHCGAVLASSCANERCSTDHSSTTSDVTRESADRALEDEFVFRIKNLDDGTEFIVDEIGEDGSFQKLRKLGTSRVYTVEEFESNFSLSPQAQRAMRRDVQKMVRSSEAVRKKTRWLKRLGVKACIYHEEMEVESASQCCQTSEHKEHMVKVHAYHKHVKEFSALYAEQDLKGHDGPISTMKFSPDGLYLATAGEDGMLRVWQILECERSEGFEINDADPSYMYFTVNDSFSHIAHLHSSKGKNLKLKTARKISDYKCVIFPEKIFRIIEKPIHEFKDHLGEVLDLSWSQSKYILSSSVDKTVRLWRVGYDQCLKIFSHNDYVSCVQFNPMDDNYFISGSIDGKIRIWDVACCQVVDWTDVHEIVTAVSYQPDGKGGVIGTISGNCRFYTASDNLVSIYAKVCCQGKKKSPLNRITGFQFSPIDPSILMVTSADSQIRIIRGIDVFCKFKGSYRSGTRMSASFDSDGKHIVSVGDGSNIYLWDSGIWEPPVPRKKNNHPCECFVSENVSIALLWPNAANGSFSLPSHLASSISGKLSQTGDPSRSQKTPLPDSSSRCSATWPEEKLLDSKPAVRSEPVMSKPDRRTSSEEEAAGVGGSCHSWGSVIVTAGSDGRIRSFQNFGLPVRV